MVKNITKTQDDDGHWYWIPNSMLYQFELDRARIEGKEYMDCPDDFDYFESKYSMYMTGGSPDNMPTFFK